MMEEISDSGLLFFQAEDGIRYLVRSRGLGDVYKRQALRRQLGAGLAELSPQGRVGVVLHLVSGGVRVPVLSLIHI